MSNRIRTYSGTLHPEISQRELEHGKLARQMASEGMVLLKNEGLLPLSTAASIALLGSGAEKTFKGGIGSGDVNNRETISIHQGMIEAGAKLTSGKWLTSYQKIYDHARETWKEKVLEAAKYVDNPFDAYSSIPFSLPDSQKIEEEDVAGAEVAIYVISRIAGEGKDRRKEAGDYYLSQKETEDLLYLNAKGLPIVLLINAGGIIELTDILQQAKNIKAVLNISQPGQEVGHAVADVIFGKAVPGGHLAATWAKRYEDYPFAEDFSYLNGNLEKEEYKEGIFVGYRYFSSFDVKPLFPFGFGLSYTEFSMDCMKVSVKGTQVVLDVNVKNVGTKFGGREVVQVYATLPQGKMIREKERLVGFAKTKELNPGESQMVTISIPQKNFASYDLEASAWIIEQGEYGVCVGKNSADLTLAAKLHVEEDAVVEHCHMICPQEQKVEELDTRPVMEEQNIVVPDLFLKPVEEVAVPYTSPVAEQQTVEELMPLLYGQISNVISTLGAASALVPGAAGETSGCLEEKYGISSLVMADGPAGVRLKTCYQVMHETGETHEGGVFTSFENGFLEPMVLKENADTYYQYCTAFPVGTALAQTWDVELLQRFGEAVAKEMREFYVDLWLAPGMNIQRNPLCGRNFEYYSEDPLLSGCIAAAVTRGVQSLNGCGVTIKHFACNNQEDHRMGVDACVSERALREIYLKGFEIAVKQGKPAAIMTSYNKINGIQAANSKDLCTTVAREEWGFDGIIMTDWFTTLPEDGSVSWKCAEAGNDVIMPGHKNDVENIREAFEKGLLSEQTIRECAGRIIQAVDKLKNNRG